MGIMDAPFRHLVPLFQLQIVPAPDEIPVVSIHDDDFILRGMYVRHRYRRGGVIRRCSRKNGMAPTTVHAVIGQHGIPLVLEVVIIRIISVNKGAGGFAEHRHLVQRVAEPDSGVRAKRIAR